MSVPTITTRPIDSNQYRTVMRHLPTGVAAVCSTDPSSGAQNGMIVGTFASLSMDPALVTFSVMNTSTSWPKIARAGRFSVNLLSQEQQEICQVIAAKGGDDKLRAVGWSESPWGTPHIEGSVAWLDCIIDQQIPAGDHLIIIASVLEMTSGEGNPLIFHGGRFGSFSVSRPTSI